MTLLGWICGAGAFAGIAYTALAIHRVRQFRAAARARTTGSMPAVSVLKPLCGNEPHLSENLASFCDQTYPRFQIVFGAADPADPALETARALTRRFPDLDIAIVAGRAQPAGNPKIGNLLGMIERAKHPLVVIADSDIHVGPQYLQAVASCFDDPQTGAATCAYGGLPGPSLPSQLGAMQINDQFTPSVMVATALEPLTYCFGATMAVRADVLADIGGLQALADRLADDYVLGKLVSDRGHRVALVPYAVQTTVADDTFATLWRHELRWGRAVYGQRPAGYAGSIVTYALPFAAAFALASHSTFSYVLLGAAALLRTWLHYEGAAAFAPQIRATPWLIPLRDLLGCAIWVSSFLGKNVRWKSSDYRLDAGGRMAVDPKEM